MTLIIDPPAMLSSSGWDWQLVLFGVAFHRGITNATGYAKFYSR